MLPLDLETVLLPENLSSSTYEKLVSRLNENEAWKSVAEYFGIFSSHDIDNLRKGNQPGEKLIFELGARLCTLGILCHVLKECHLYDILMLFKDYEPAKIIDQSSATGDNNTQMVPRGQDFALHVKAVGIPSPTYQWYHDSAELYGQIESTLILQNFDLKNEGLYFCLIVQEGHGSTSSKPIQLRLAPEKPVILKQPCAQNVMLHSKVVLSVKAAGYPALNYQWYRGNRQLDGCTRPCLVIDAVREDLEGTYRCYIHNAAGEVWSEEAALVIYAPPDQKPSAKVALLVANQLYDNLKWLYTPERDAKTLADLLRDLGFLVVGLQNLRLTEMRNAIRKFARLLPADAYVVFYFAGHGFEIHDKFMLPVDSPGPEDYLQSDAVSERELLRDLLASRPMLLLSLLDMCLKPPSPFNKKIFQKVTELYEYEANNNLIQGYSTTSCLGAYEKKTERNGLYIEHFKRCLERDKNLSVVEILQNVAKDVAALGIKQKPFFGTNVTVDYRLTDPCRPHAQVRERIEALSRVPEDAVLCFDKVGVRSEIFFSLHLGVFLNTLEVRFSNLQDFRTSCEAIGEELSLELTRDGDILVMKVMNIQRLMTSKALTMSLTKGEKVLDCGVWNIGKPTIAAADLWWDPQSVGI